MMVTLPIRERYNRTECACLHCIANCQSVPGMLVPDDLWPLASREIGDAALQWPAFSSWAERNLLASPGAMVAARTANGEQICVFRIGTLVPRADASGVCHWLTDECKCVVHEIAPFGCSHFDHHMPQSVGQERSGAALREVAATFDQKPRGLYAATWHHLWNKGLRSASPEEKRSNACL